MRWLIIHPGPAFSVSDVYNGWAEALRNAGQDVFEFNLDKRLMFFDSALFETGEVDDGGHPQVRKALKHDEAVTLASEGVMSACYRCWPDVVLGISAFFTPPQMLDVMRARHHKVVLLHTESPYQDDEQLARAAHADINLLNDPVNLQAYRDLGAPAEYMPHAYRPGTHYPGPALPAVDYDLLFVGTGFKSRINFFEEMHRHLGGVSLGLAGPWPELPLESPLHKHVLFSEWCTPEEDPQNSASCLDNDMTAAYYRSARMGINVYRQEAEKAHQGQGWSMGPREVEMAACGLFFLRDARPESDEVFPMLPAFESPEHAAELARWYLKHEDARKAKAAAAREAIVERTFDNNLKRLMALLRA